MATWKLVVTRRGEQVRAGKRRTVGGYQVFVDGEPVAGLSGDMAETRGPGDNSRAGNNRCIEAGTYHIHIQSGSKYATIGYTARTNPVALRRPGLLVMPTHPREGILIHPARGFLWSIGCLNPASALTDASADIDFLDSRSRVIALIESLRATVRAFPTDGGARIPGATLEVR